VFFAGRTPSLSLLLVLRFVFCLCILHAASWPHRWTDYGANRRFKPQWSIGDIFVYRCHVYRDPNFKRPAGLSAITGLSCISLMPIATGRPVWPINAVNGSNDASLWHSLNFTALYMRIHLFIHSFIHIPSFIHGLCHSTKLRSCCISDEPCQWERANFDPPLHLNLLTDRSETQI